MFSVNWRLEVWNIDIEVISVENLGESRRINIEKYWPLVGNI